MLLSVKVSNQYSETYYYYYQILSLLLYYKWEMLYFSAPYIPFIFVKSIQILCLRYTHKKKKKNDSNSKLQNNLYIINCLRNQDKCRVSLRVFSSILTNSKIPGNRNKIFESRLWEYSQEI